MCERTLLAVALCLRLHWLAQIADRVGDRRFSEPVRLHAWQLDAADGMLNEWVNRQVRLGVLAVVRETPSAMALFQPTAAGDVEGASVSPTSGAANSVADSCQEICRSSRLLSSTRALLALGEVGAWGAPCC